MKKRFVIYFHYDPHGQADSACLFMVRAVARVAARVLFVTNGKLTANAAAAVRETGAELLERENIGLDVGAYRDALRHWPEEERASCDELVLMNYTLAGPVFPLEQMFAAMEKRPELDFWGITRHYAMKSSRFKTAYGAVPEHIQSHFIAVRPRLFRSPAFWDYWENIPLPQSYEESVARHEARFTRWFSDRGFRWDTYVDTKDLAGVFVNPIMGCPAELVAHRACPVFKRRSFFTPYRDELRRTAGEATGELYSWLKTATDYPVEELVASLLATQPLTALAQNLHWHLPLYPLPALPQTQNQIQIVRIKSGKAEELPPLRPGTLVCLVRETPATTPESWYAQKAASQLYADTAMLAAIADSFVKDPMLGLVSPALPPYPPLFEERLKEWRKILPPLRHAMAEKGVTVPLDETQPLPLPFADCAFLRADAFCGRLPNLAQPESWWLLPLLAQQNGYIGKTASPAGMALYERNVLEDTLYSTRQGRELARALGRAVKHHFKHYWQRGRNR